MPTILICPLGQSPGVVTGTLDALLHADSPVMVNKVVLLWLQHRSDARANILPATVRILQEEFRAHYPDIELDLNSGRLILDDVNDSDSNILFYECAAKVIRGAGTQQETQVLVSVSGGRKTMATLTLLAAAVEGIETVRNFYHLIVDDAIEEIGSVTSWKDANDRQRALHPPIGTGNNRLIQLPSPAEIVHRTPASGSPASSIREVA